MKPSTKTELIKTVRSEINKQGIIYSGGMISKIYTAPISAVAGDYCHVREFVYYPSTTIVKGRKEGYDVWLQEFEDAFSLSDFLVDELDNQLTDELGNNLIGAP